MAFRPVGSVLRYLRLIVAPRDGGELTDGQLLQRFVDRGDEGAFETLVLRHGGTVLGACRRVLGHEQDAEDAFQATFLVLARKAASIGSRETVGNWLYGVAYRTARKAKVTNARRRNRETQAASMLRENHETKEVWSELQPLLDHELHRLPAKYRSPLVLCDLEGKTRSEAARQLGLARGHPVVAAGSGAVAARQTPAAPRRDAVRRGAGAGARPKRVSRRAGAADRLHDQYRGYCFFGSGRRGGLDPSRRRRFNRRSITNHVLHQAENRGRDLPDLGRHGHGSRGRFLPCLRRPRPAGPDGGAGR